MTEDKDPPIVAPGFLGGVNVVDIGDLRVARGLSRRPYSICPHKRLMYDHNERRVWCCDCEKNVDAFEAFELLCEQFDQASKKIERDRAEIDKALKHALISVASKTMDQAWRHRTMVPACPHCSQGLFPEDFRNQPSMLGRDYAEAIRSKRKGD